MEGRQGRHSIWFGPDGTVYGVNDNPDVDSGLVPSRLTSPTAEVGFARVFTAPTITAAIFLRQRPADVRVN